MQDAAWPQTPGHGDGIKRIGSKPIDRLRRERDESTLLDDFSGLSDILRDASGHGQSNRTLTDSLR